MAQQLPFDAERLDLELLDVTPRVRLTRSPTPVAASDPKPEASPPARAELLTIENLGSDPIDTDLMVILRGLTQGMRLLNADGITLLDPDPLLPYRRLSLEGGVLEPGGHVTLRLLFAAPPRTRPDYQVVLLAGQKTP